MKRPADNDNETQAERCSNADNGKAQGQGPVNQEESQVQHIEEEQRQEKVHKKRDPVRANLLKKIQALCPHKADKHKSVTE
jgi:hypothetical protein